MFRVTNLLRKVSSISPDLIKLAHLLKIDIKNNGEDLTESEAYYIRQHPYLVERSPTWVEKIEANAKGYNIILAPSEHNSTELIEQVQNIPEQVQNTSEHLSQL